MADQKIDYEAGLKEFGGVLAPDYEAGLKEFGGTIAGPAPSRPLASSHSEEPISLATRGAESSPPRIAPRVQDVFSPEQSWIREQAATKRPSFNSPVKDPSPVVQDRPGPEAVRPMAPTSIPPTVETTPVGRANAPVPGRIPGMERLGGAAPSVPPVAAQINETNAPSLAGDVGGGFVRGVASGAFAIPRALSRVPGGFRDDINALRRTRADIEPNLGFRTPEQVAEDEARLRQISNSDINRFEQAALPAAPVTGAGKFAEALGSTAPYMAAGVAGPAGPAALGILAGTEESLGRSDASGIPLTDAQRLGVGAAGAAIGSTEALPFGRLLGRLKGAGVIADAVDETQLVKQLFPGLKDYAVSAGKQAFEEGVQEGTSNVLQDVTEASYGGRPVNRIGEGLGESVTTGGGVGALVDVLTTLAGSRAGRARLSQNGVDPAALLAWVQAQEKVDPMQAEFNMLARENRAPNPRSRRRPRPSGGPTPPPAAPPVAPTPIPAESPAPAPPQQAEVPPQVPPPPAGFTVDPLPGAIESAPAASIPPAEPQPGDRDYVPLAHKYGWDDGKEWASNLIKDYDRFPQWRDEGYKQAQLLLSSGLPLHKDQAARLTAIVQGGPPAAEPVPSSEASEMPAPVKQDAAPDDAYRAVIDFAAAEGDISTGKLQKQFKMPFGDAVRMMQRLEADGQIEPPQGRGKQRFIGQQAAQPVPAPDNQDSQSSQKLVAFDSLPKYAQQSIMEDSMMRRTNEGGSIDAPDPYADVSWERVSVPIESLKPKNEMLWGGGSFKHRGSMTKGPIVVNDRGEVIDGNNRLFEAIRDRKATIEVYRATKPSAKDPVPAPGPREEVVQPAPVDTAAQVAEVQSEQEPDATLSPEVTAPPSAVEAAAPEAPERFDDDAPLYDKTPDELQSLHDELKANDKNIVVELFGEQGAKVYERASRSESDKARAVVEDMEDRLTEQQRNRLYGIGDKYGADEVGAYLKAFNELDFGNPASLGYSLQWALSLVGEKKDPQQMGQAERVAYATIRNAFERASDLGFDQQVVMDEALRNAAARFSDPEDARFMLRRFMREPGKPAQAQSQPPGQLAAPEAQPPAAPKEPPAGVAASVKRYLETISDVNRQLAEARTVDDKFGGEGRYENEVWDRLMGEDGAVTAEANKKLQVFRELAVKNGVDAEAFIEKMGGMPESPALSERAKKYRGESVPPALESPGERSETEVAVDVAPDTPPAPNAVAQPVIKEDLTPDAPPDSPAGSLDMAIDQSEPSSVVDRLIPIVGEKYAHGLAADIGDISGITPDQPAYRKQAGSVADMVLQFAISESGSKGQFGTASIGKDGVVKIKKTSGYALPEPAIISRAQEILDATLGKNAPKYPLAAPKGTAPEAPAPTGPDPRQDSMFGEQGDSEVVGYAPKGTLGAKPPSNGSRGKKATPPTGPRTGTAVSRSEIVKNLSSFLNNIPIRTGGFRERAAGIFKVRQNVIRTAKALDLETISHEIGHAIHKYLWGTRKGSLVALNLKPLRPFQNELGLLDYDQNKQRAYEGFAEYIRLRITKPAEAKQRAPRFHSWFNQKLSEAPELADVLKKAQEQYSNWDIQPSTVKLAKSIDTKPNHESFIKRVTDGMSDFRYNWIDDKTGLRDAVELFKRLGADVSDALNAYRLARTLSGTFTRANFAITNKTVGADNAPNGAGLGEILKPIADRDVSERNPAFQKLVDDWGINLADDGMDDFRVYIVARRLLDYRDKGLETGFTLQELKRAVADTVTPAVKEAAEELHEYSGRILDYAYEKGAMTEETREAIRSKNEFYVPLHRVMDNVGAEDAKAMLGRKMLDLNSPVLKRKGSTREIIDPLESVIKNTYAIMSFADRNAVAQALVKQAERVSDQGYLVESGIVNPMKATTFNLKEVGKDIMAALEEAGIDGSELELDHMSTIFRPNMDPRRSNGVVRVIVDGIPKLYQMDKNLIRALDNTDAQSADLFKRMAANAAASLRFGATAGNPEFILTNFFRDQFMAGIQSRNGYIPIVSGMWGAFKMLSDPKAFQEWQLAGGATAAMMPLTRKNLRLTVDKVTKSKKDLVLTHPAQIFPLLRDALTFFGEKSEASTRFAEYLLAKGKGKSTAEAVFDSRDVSLDFERMGKIAKTVNQFVPFFSVALNASERFVEMHNPRNKKQFAQSLAKGLLGITIPTMMLWLLNKDDEEYKNVEAWKRDLFWLIPTKYLGLREEFGPFIRIPKPPMWGQLYGSFFERLADSLYSHNKHAFDDFGKTAFQTLLPPASVQAIKPVEEVMSNYNAFTDRPIETEFMKKLSPENRYTPTTSELSKGISKVIGGSLSPVQVEHLLLGYTAGLGRVAITAGEELSGLRKDRPAMEASERPFIRAFATPSSPYLSTDFKLFKERLEKLKQKQADFKFSKDPKYRMTSAEESKLSKLEDINERVNEIRSKQFKVYGNKALSRDEKRRQLDMMNKQRDEILKRTKPLYD